MRRRLHREGRRLQETQGLRLQRVRRSSLSARSLSRAAITSAGVIALVAAGYFANEWRVCNGLEADYLEEMTALGTNMQTGAAMEDMAEVAVVGERIALGAEDANRIYFRVKSRCGADRAYQMQREGLAVIEDLRKQLR